MTPLARLRASRRRESRSAFLDSARRYSPTLAVGHPAGIFVAPAHDRSILRKLFLDGGRSDFVVLERAVQTLAAQGRSVNGTFVDIGANLGTTTLAAIRLHGFEKAIAVEPDPLNVRHLRASVALNELEDQVTVLHAAVTDGVGVASFRASVGRIGRKSGSGGLDAEGAFSVQTTSLDALVDLELVSPGDVGLVWMDVQGAEGAVFAGAEAFFAAGVSFVSAVRAKRLAKLGGLELFTHTVRDRFSSFVDLRAPNLKSPWAPRLRPVAQFGEILALPNSTDVLLLP